MEPVTLDPRSKAGDRQPSVTARTGHPSDDNDSRLEAVPDALPDDYRPRELLPDSPAPEPEGVVLLAIIAWSTVVGLVFVAAATRGALLVFFGGPKWYREVYVALCVGVTLSVAGSFMLSYRPHARWIMLALASCLAAVLLVFTAKAV
ncbi:hypothetical protein ACFO1B_53010 [Dactylosporangium siamense]|uniref:Uncharacterized protein n=1 Tax=Dactylosporangium siamense TaxID=685454 RepID=A0A919Q0G3_9ACTN|nr:hypothetical protein [Dactylosporangium siamense]GIG52626.1 hypothetical protein Dsi01nite_106670 [Dactylosporangium siamense]